MEFLLTVLAAVGWFMNLLGIFGSLLPLCAFTVTKDWVKDFDCFGVCSLCVDLIMSFIKAFMYLLLAGLNDETCNIIFDTVNCTCMGGCLIGCSLFSYMSYKSQHGMLPKLRWKCFGLLAVFVASVGMVLLGMQKKWHAAEWITLLMMGLVMVTQLFETLYPLVMRLWSPTFSHDESAVVAWKSVASTILILTSVYDAWSFSVSLQGIISPQSASWHLAMCLSGAVAGAIQLVMRLSTFAAHRFLQGSGRTCFSAARDWIKKLTCSTGWYFDITVNFLQGHAASICSVFSTAFTKLKDVFGGL